MLALRLVACLGVLVAAGATCGPGAASDGGSSATAAAAAKRARFSDARREDPQAPDIAAVVVSNTDAPRASASTITFRIEISNRPVLRKDMSIAVWVDADDDPGTGLGEQGAFPGGDYVLVWDRTLSEDASLLRCARSGCRTASARTFRFSYARGATFSVQAAELGDARRFRFAARAYSGPAGDFAPAEGKAWSYRLLVRKPAVPHGSRTLTVRFTVTRADGSVLTRGRVSCTGTIGGKRVEPRSERFVGRRATCVFVLPLSAVGKKIRGTITVVSGATRVTKTFQRTLR